ncbi:MAG: MBL fold metallo-hydrolase [Ruminococcaceae bacterium]|nr:MBL fold metallo-hydrolase [Oscillospiraceae bacterium]
MKIKKLVLWLLHTNCYIIYNENTNNAVVVDPAGNFEKIKSEIESLQLNVKYIIITHAHIDHMIALDELKNYTGASLVMHKDELEIYKSSEYNISVHFKKETPKSNPEILVSDNDEIEFDQIKLKFIHTPGHTKGGMCILTGNYLISGDTLFNGSVGRCDFYSGDMDALLNSIREKLFVLDDDVVVYPGHGDETTIGFEKENNMFLK